MRYLGASLLTMTSSIALCQSAFAQDTSAQGTESEVTSGNVAEQRGFEEIIVTARRREENLQEVPVAVTALSGDSLERNSILNMQDLTKATPSLQIVPSAFSQNTPRFTIRSQSQFEPLLTLDPSVAVYFADVVQSRAHGLNAAMYDLESVQVLKGPQGTLFGRNTTGGAVLIQPKAPEDDFHGYLKMNIGDYNLMQAEGMVNIPLNQNFAARVSGRLVRRDGYALNRATGERANDAHNEAWRVALAYDSLNGLTNTLFVNGFSANERGAGFKLTGVTPTGLFASAYPTALQLLAEQQAADFQSYSSEQRGNRSIVDTISIANTTELELGAVTLKNIFGYRNVESFSRFDYDGTTFAMFDSSEILDANQFSNEFQVLGDAIGGDLDWIVGAYYFREKGVNIQQGQLNFPGIFSQATVDRGDVKNTSYSAFAQLNYALPFLEGLSVTAGGRYTVDERELLGGGTNFGVCNRTDSAGMPLVPCARYVKDTFKSPTYTLGLDWQITPDHLLYIAHRRGYRSGGFNLRARSPEEFVPFEPEIVSDVELGVKADWYIGDSRLRTNFAVYHQSYDEIQRVQATLINNLLVTTIVNAASATVNGFEFDATWEVADFLEMRGFYAYSDAKYDEWQVPLAGGGFDDLSANKFSYAPRHSAGGSIRLTQELGKGNGTLALQGDVYYQSEVQFQDINVIPDGVESGYAIGNLRFDWKAVGGSPIDIGVWVRNVADKKYHTSGVPISAFGSTVKTIGAPRTMGFEMGFNF